MVAYSGAGGNFFQVLYQWGFLDAILPFLLIFIIIFAVLQKIGLFKTEGDKSDKRINGILALVIAAMVVFPHVLNLWTDPASDPVNVINKILPVASALLVAVLLVIVLLGLAGGTIPNAMAWLVALVALILLVFVILSAIFPEIIPALLRWQFLQSPANQAALIILGIMALVVYFVMREPSDKGFSLNKWLKDWMG